MNTLNFLKSLEFMKNFSMPDLEEILRSSSVRAFRAEEKILDDNQKGKYFGIIMEGSVIVCTPSQDGTTQIAAILKEKNYFGEIGLMSGESTTVDLIGQKQGKVLLVPQNIFSEYLAKDPKAIKHFAISIAQRLRSTNKASDFASNGYANHKDLYGLDLEGTDPPAKILVVNCGSSSLKYNFYDTADSSKNFRGIVESIGNDISEFSISSTSEEKSWKIEINDHKQALLKVFEVLIEYGIIKDSSEITAVGHRVVHGGERYSNPEVITDDVIREIEKNTQLAPLHNPINLMGIMECKKIMPKVSQVAVFDTAFHNKMPKSSYLYGIPYKFYSENGIRRYGFHGSSHHYVSLMASSYLNKPFTSLKIISCHLGSGASVCAIKRGRSIDTSMGITPLEGLMMGTRSGDIDPAIIPFLMKKVHSIEEVEEILLKESGLKGVSEITDDMQELLKLAEEGNEKAQLAIEMFCYKVRKYIGSYIAALGGLDLLIFTGGIGERGFDIRWLVCQELSFLGITIDEKQNRRKIPTEGILDVSYDDHRSKVKVLAIRTDEERMIARETIRSLGIHNATKVIKSKKIAIPIGVSAHHVHLSERNVAILFGDGYVLKKKADLLQTGQYACEDMIDLIGPKGVVNNVRILGPVRSRTQVEISRTEEFKLGIDAPVRDSGDIEGSPGIKLKGPRGTVTITEGVICAHRHIHMSPTDAIKFGLKNKDLVAVRMEAERPLVFGGTLVRVHPSFKLEMHVDTDEANAAALVTGSKGYFESLEERKGNT